MKPVFLSKQPTHEIFNLENVEDSGDIWPLSLGIRYFTFPRLCLLFWGRSTYASMAYLWLHPHPQTL